MPTCIEKMMYARDELRRALARADPAYDESNPEVYKSSRRVAKRLKEQLLPRFWNFSTTRTEEDFLKVLQTAGIADSVKQARERLELMLRTNGVEYGIFSVLYVTRHCDDHGKIFIAKQLTDDDFHMDYMMHVAERADSAELEARKS